MPLVFAFVLGLAFLLMMVTFRSIVIPIKAIILNLLSVGAAYGVLVLVFQHGWGESLLGFESNGGVTNWLPLFLFVILFGLSMDYHVFILTRVRELYDRGMSTEDAVRKGIAGSAGTVTAAAVVMVARVQRVRDPLLHRFQGDGRRARGRDPDRRDDHPGRPAAGEHEAARRLELVPAEVTRLAAAGSAEESRRRSPGPTRRAGEGLAPAAHSAVAPRGPHQPARCGPDLPRTTQRHQRGTYEFPRPPQNETNHASSPRHRRRGLGTAALVAGCDAEEEIQAAANEYEGGKLQEQLDAVVDAGVPGAVLLVQDPGADPIVLSAGVSDRKAKTPMSATTGSGSAA